MHKTCIVTEMSKKVILQITPSVMQTSAYYLHTSLAPSEHTWPLAFNLHASSHLSSSKQTLTGNLCCAAMAKDTRNWEGEWRKKSKWEKKKKTPPFFLPFSVKRWCSRFGYVLNYCTSVCRRETIESIQILVTGESKETEEWQIEDRKQIV